MVFSLDLLPTVRIFVRNTCLFWQILVRYSSIRLFIIIINYIEPSMLPILDSKTHILPYNIESKNKIDSISSQVKSLFLLMSGQIWKLSDRSEWE